MTDAGSTPGAGYTANSPLRVSPHQPGGVRVTHDRVGQGRQTTIHDPPLQALRERCRGPGCIAKPPSRRRQSQPDLTDVVLATELREQGRRPCVVLADGCRCQSQCHGWIARRHTVRPIQPAQRLSTGCRQQRRPDPARMPRVPAPRHPEAAPAQLPRSASGRLRLGSLCLGAGGRVARSARASCRPCASARSLQTRARSKSRSPASPRAR